MLINYTLRKTILAAITGVAKPLGFAGLKIGFYNTPLANDVHLSRATVLAADATFHGYTAGGYAPTGWGATYSDGAGNVYQDSLPMVEAVSTDAVVDETIYGAYIDTGADVIIDPFPAPIRVNAADIAVRYLFTFPFGQ